MAQHLLVCSRYIVACEGTSDLIQCRIMPGLRTRLVQIFLWGHRNLGVEQKWPLLGSMAWQHWSQVHQRHPHIRGDDRCTRVGHHHRTEDGQWSGALLFLPAWCVVNKDMSSPPPPSHGGFHTSVSNKDLSKTMPSRPSPTSGGSSRTLIPCKQYGISSPQQCKIFKKT